MLWLLSLLWVTIAVVILLIIGPLLVLVLIIGVIALMLAVAIIIAALRMARHGEESIAQNIPMRLSSVLLSFLLCAEAVLELMLDVS